MTQTYTNNLENVIKNNISIAETKDESSVKE